MSSFPVPGTKKQVRTFLGLTGYYRRFIPSYATIAAPLTDLTKKDCPNRVKWTPGCEEAFCKLKRVLCAAPVLCNFDQTFLLQTDASDRGVGAVLGQVDSEGDEHPIGFFSRKLLARGQRYSTVEKECLEIKLAVFFFFFHFPQMGRISRKLVSKPLLGKETRKPGEKSFLGATGGTRTCGLSHHSPVL